MKKTKPIIIKLVYYMDNSLIVLERDVIILVSIKK
jgi:hypothetical protein